MQSSSRFSIALIAGALLTSPLRSQAAPLTLGDALHEADRRAFGNRIATAATAGERARARLPLVGILPSGRVEAGVIRTTDPVGAFGTTLRQRLVTPTAFDPAKLNYPSAVTNVQSGLVLEVPLLNGDAWLGLRAARAAADASSAAGAWSAVSIRAEVVRSYYGAILAGIKTTVLADAERAADAGVRQVRSMVAQGLVTKADVLQASVRASDVSAQLVSARSDAESARQQLALLMGRTTGDLPTLPTRLPDDSAVVALASRDREAAGITMAITGGIAASLRDDVRAAQAGMTAATADRRRAASTLLPRVNGFARYDWNDPRTLYGGPKNWTVGVMASWSLIGGNSGLADIAAASARADAARAKLDAAQAQSRLDRDDAARRLTVSMERLTLAGQSADQSREAYRLVQKRYDGGLATIAELLTAEASATSASLAHAAARYALIDAIAVWRRASGGDPSALIALESLTTTAR